MVDDLVTVPLLTFMEFFCSLVYWNCHVTGSTRERMPNEYVKHRPPTCATRARCVIVNKMADLHEKSSDTAIM